MRIMTINIWGDYYNNAVEVREDGIYNVIKEYSPDIFGLQEMTLNWYNSKFSKLVAENYTCINIYGENYVPLYFKKDMFEMLRCGWEHYDDTPDISKSITWAVLQNKSSGKKIAALNTHLWFKEGREHDILREKNAHQLINLMKHIKKEYDVPVFSFGDFNCTIDSGAFGVMEAENVYTAFKLTDNYSPSATYHDYPILGDDGKFHGKETSDNYTKSLDHIVTFKNDVVIKKQDVIIYQEILDSTDHSPVYIDIEI